MSEAFTDPDWKYLVDLVHKCKCTPFIGAGACYGTLPTGSQLAQEWAEKYEYPFQDSCDLARVAQYLAINMGGMFPKDTIEDIFNKIDPPDFSDPNEPHIALARLNLPIYITTNYDNFMVDALEYLGRPYKRDFSRWNDTDELRETMSVFDDGYKPSPEEPLIYHLHGYYETPRSLVLTESDYLEFLLKFATEPDFLPPIIRTALAGTSLLFVGYSLNDYNFRVLFRGINKSVPSNLQYRCNAIQLPPEGRTVETKRHAMEYLQSYLQRINNIQVRVYWGDARSFMAKLVGKLGETL